MNARFSDYVTSGAFSLTLTRNQIAELSLVAGGERRFYWPAAALERKGLIEAIPESVEENPLHERNEQMLEWRLTGAGALVLSLLAQAGLSNSGADVLTREIDDLRARLAMANSRAHDAALRTRSMHARLCDAEAEIAILRARQAGEKIPIRITPCDPLPNLSAEELLTPERT